MWIESFWVLKYESVKLAGRMKNGKISKIPLQPYSIDQFTSNRSPTFFSTDHYEAPHFTWPLEIVLADL